MTKMKTSQLCVFCWTQFISSSVVRAHCREYFPPSSPALPPPAANFKPKIASLEDFWTIVRTPTEIMSIPAVSVLHSQIHSIISTITDQQKGCLPDLLTWNVRNSSPWRWGGGRWRGKDSAPDSGHPADQPLVLALGSNTNMDGHSIFRLLGWCLASPVGRCWCG